MVTVGEMDLIDYEELSRLTGRSVGALRVARTRGQLPDQDAPGPKWRRESLAGFLAEGVRVPASGPPVPEVAPASAPPSSGTPELPAERTAAPVTAVPPKEPFVGEDAEDRRRRSMTLEQVLACPHPADDLKKLSYATICVVCGRRQVGRDTFVGAGYAGWDKAKLAACTHPVAERVRHLSGHDRCALCNVLLKDPAP